MESPNVVLDVRTVPPRDRHPKIVSAWRALPVGASLTLVNDHDPKPLFYEFKAERAGEFEWTAVERGPERWSVEIKRVAAPAGAITGETEEKPRAPRPDWAGEADHEVDVREDLRAGREPFAKIIGAVAAVKKGQTLLLRAIFEPKPLYKVLALRGFTPWAEKVGDEDWAIWLRRC